MKNPFSILVLGLLVVDGAIASKCRPSKPASSSAVLSSASSASSSAPSSSSVPASSSSPIPSSSSSSVPSSPSSPLPPSSSVVVSSSSSPVPSSSSVVASSSSSSSAPAAPSAPCTNVIVDGDFSDGFNGWGVSTQGVGNSYGSYTCTPNYAVCGLLAVDSADDIINISQDITLVAGVVYTFNVDYYLQTPAPDVSGQLVCSLNPLATTTKRRRGSPAGGPAGGLTTDAITFTIEMQSAASDNSTTTHGTVAARRSPLRRQTPPTFTNYHTSFTAPASEPLQLLCSFTATGIAEASLADFIVQPAECFTTFP